MVYSEHGDPEKVLKCHEFHIPEPAADEFLVRFLAAPINPADINQIQGVYPKRPAFTEQFHTSVPSAVGGNEGLVEIIKAGKDNLSMKWNLGEWAIMRRTTFGTWRSHALAKAADLLPISSYITPSQSGDKGVGPIDAATISVNSCTAYRMLQDFAKLKPGDWFIQNGANAAVGKCAIQMGKIWGYKSINIIRERPGCEQVKQDLLDLGADEVITTEELENKDLMKSRYGDREIKLALNCIGGPLTVNMCKLISDGAQVVTYGAMSRQPLRIPAALLIFRTIQFHGFWVSPWIDAHPEEREVMLKELFEWIKQGRFRSPEVNLNEWSMDQSLEEAQKIFMSALTNKTMKQVMTMHF